MPDLIEVMNDEEPYGTIPADYQIDQKTIWRSTQSRGMKKQGGMTYQ